MAAKSAAETTAITEPSFAFLILEQKRAEDLYDFMSSGFRV
jgi:hypothetical protein